MSCQEIRAVWISHRTSHWSITSVTSCWSGRMSKRCPVLEAMAQSHALQSVAYKTDEDLRTCHFNDVFKGFGGQQKKVKNKRNYCIFYPLPLWRKHGGWPLSLGLVTTQCSGWCVGLSAAAGSQSRRRLCKRARLLCLEAGGVGSVGSGRGERCSMELMARFSGKVPKQAPWMPRQGHVNSNSELHTILRNSF